jgi:hypothetical protein
MHLVCCHENAYYEASMARKTLAIHEELLNEAKALSGAKTKKDVPHLLQSQE